RPLGAVARWAVEKIVRLVGAADAAHPSRAVADADHADDAPDPTIDGGDPDDGSAAVARPVQADPLGIDLGKRPEERHGCLNVGDPAVGREPAARPRTLPPALVIEGHHHVPGLGERPRVVRKVQVLDPRVAVALDGRPSRGTAGSIVIDGLPTSDADLQQYRKRIRRSSAYATQLLSASRLHDTDRLAFAVERDYDAQAQVMGMDLEGVDIAVL